MEEGTPESGPAGNPEAKPATPAVLEPAAPDGGLAPVAIAEPPPPDPGTTLPASPATPRKSRRRVWLAIGLIVLLVLLGGGAGVFLANQALSARYSPQQAVVDYFAAQAKADVIGMMASSMFDRPAGSYAGLFNEGALAQMLKVPQNEAIGDVRIQSIEPIDDTNVLARVSMTWAGTNRNATYTVRKDGSESHYYFYHSWRLVIPNGTIAVKLPNQPGQVLIDQIVSPPTSEMYVIAGFHDVQMVSNQFWDSEDSIANAVDGSAKVTFQGKVSSVATASAAAAVKAALPNCDATKYNTCEGHTYYAPDKGDVWYFVMPGYGEVDYNYYVFNLSGDLTQGMALVVTADDGKVNASGTCTETMTVDGSRNYSFKGTWTAVLTWTGAAFSAHVTTDCHSSRA